MLFVGDDWAETHHDVELMDAAGRRLAKARLSEGVVGMARLHAMIGEQLGEDTDEAQVVVGIETDPGTVGTGVDRRRVHSVCDQSVAGGLLPETAQRVRRQERCR